MKRHRSKRRNPVFPLGGMVPLIVAAAGLVVAGKVLPAITIGDRRPRFDMPAPVPPGEPPPITSDCAGLQAYYANAIRNGTVSGDWWMDSSLTEEQRAAFKLCMKAGMIPQLRFADDPTTDNLTVSGYRRQPVM